MTFPRTSVGSGTTKVSSQALPFTVTDIDMWDTVAAAIINQPDVTWQMTGDASLTANFGGIKLTFGGIPFDKSVTLLDYGGYCSTRMRCPLSAVRSHALALTLTLPLHVTTTTTTTTTTRRWQHPFYQERHPLAGLFDHPGHLDCGH